MAADNDLLLGLLRFSFLLLLFKRLVVTGRVLLDGQSPFVFGGDGGLAWLTGTTLAWLAAGLVTFATGERIAKNRGSLSRY